MNHRTTQNTFSRYAATVLWTVGLGLSGNAVGDASTGTERLTEGAKQLASVACAGQAVASFGGFEQRGVERSFACGKTTTITREQVADADKRADAYMRYIMGGTEVPANLRDAYWDQAPGSDFSTSVRLCALREGLQRGDLTIKRVGATMQCGTPVNVFEIAGEISSAVFGACGSTFDKGLGVAETAKIINENLAAHSEHCPPNAEGSFSPVTFFQLASLGPGTTWIDPAPAQITANPYDICGELYPQSPPVDSQYFACESERSSEPTVCWKWPNTYENCPAGMEGGQPCAASSVGVGVWLYGTIQMMEVRRGFFKCRCVE